MSWTGRCRCGHISWSIADEPNWQCYCHCDDCRRNCSAPVVAWIGADLNGFNWTTEEPKVWESSPGTYRHFCGLCGTPMAFIAEHYSDEIALYAASLDSPELFKPSFHLNVQSQLSWLNIHDDLERYSNTLLNNKNQLKKLGNKKGGY